MTMTKPVGPDQLVLLPEGPVTLSWAPYTMIRDLDYLPGVPPTAALCASVKRLGVLVPILIRSGKNGRWEIIDGRRRVLAAEAAGLTKVPAQIAEGLEGPMSPASLTLLLNEQRRPNPLAELEAIERLVAEGATTSEIARATGLAVGTIRQRMRLRDLHPTLRELADDGILSPALLEQAAKLPSNAQAALAMMAREGEKITTAKIREVQQVRRVEASATLPADLFEVPAWEEPPVLDEAAIRIEERGRIADWMGRTIRSTAHIKEVIAAIRAGSYLDGEADS